MARPLAAGPLSLAEPPPVPVSAGAVVFDLAAPEDEAEVRRLLGENPLPGEVTVALEREGAGAAAGDLEGDFHQLLVARQAGSGRLVGMASRAVAEVFLNGRPRRVGYLGQLRLAAPWRRRRRFLQSAFGFLRRLHEDGRAPFYFASLMADNRAAHRLLTAGLPGLPVFCELAELVTLVVPVPVAVPAAVRWRRRPPPVPLETGSRQRLDETAACLERHARRHQLARRWTAADLLSPRRTPGLSPEDFVLATDGTRVIGCAALWDQRSFKQTRVVAYAPALARLRPWLNLAAPWLGTPRLPAVGEVLRQAFVSHLAVDGDQPEVALALVEALCRRAARRRLDYLVLGLPAASPLLPVLRRRLRPREIHSVLHAVHWAEDEGARKLLDGLESLPFHAEVAVL
jgi:hypothetical protein